MKIGIVTLPLHTNYGGILQTYALQTILERMGHKVCVIEQERFLPIELKFWQYPVNLAKYAILKYVLRRGNISILQDFTYNRKELPVLKANYEIKSKHTRAFFEKHIHFRRFKKITELKSEEFDALVVGSDQIWRPMYAPVEYAFLSFAKDWNVKRIAYAPSFGTDVWEFSTAQTLLAKELIKKFDAVSVREASGVDLCKSNLQIKAEHMIDPTLLLQVDDYCQLFSNTSSEEHKGILEYIIDGSEEKSAMAAMVKNVLKKDSFSVNSRAEDTSGKQYSLEDMIQPPVENWLKGFSAADFVVTDSFHACVFSIIYHKPFIALGNKKRGLSRFESLLGMFGLQERLITDSSQLFHELIMHSIDFANIDKLLNVKRQEAYTYLSKELNDPKT